MAPFQLFSYSFLSVFLLICFHLQPSTSVEICRVLCGSQLVRFPFRLTDQADRCGYPGFELISCKNQTQTILTLPFSGDFLVQNIDYASQIIWISDPDYCTPKRLLESFSLFGTPFHPLYPLNFTFFKCSYDVPIEPGLRPIFCLSGDNYTVVAVPTNRYDTFRSRSSCQEMATVLAPVTWPVWSDLSYGVMLTWKEPDCRSCENRQGSCRLKSETGLQVGCSGGFTSGLSTGAKYGIIFGVGIPLLTILAVTISLCRGEVRGSSQLGRRQPNPGIANSVGPAAAAKGLDGPTIESYPTTLLGESRRLPEPSDNTCPICLSEYQAEEILRTIPDCKHYFHANCIDEWLKLNATCPLCRNSQPSSSSLET